MDAGASILMGSWTVLFISFHFKYAFGVTYIHTYRVFRYSPVCRLMCDNWRLVTPFAAAAVPIFFFFFFSVRWLEFSAIHLSTLSCCFFFLASLPDAQLLNSLHELRLKKKISLHLSVKWILCQLCVIKFMFCSHTNTNRTLVGWFHLERGKFMTYVCDWTVSSSSSIWVIFDKTLFFRFFFFVFFFLCEY